MFCSTTGSSSCSSCRSVNSVDMEPPSYLYLLVALNISVYPSDIKSMGTWMLRVLSSYP